VAIRAWIGVRAPDQFAESRFRILELPADIARAGGGLARLGHREVSS
jgi:hypothetical protein